MPMLDIYAYPSHFKVEPGRNGRARVFHVGVGNLAEFKVQVWKLSEIKNAVQAFGKKVAEDHPGTSFAIHVGVASDSRAPNGFKKANHATDFGCDDWMQEKSGYEVVA